MHPRSTRPTLTPATRTDGEIWDEPFTTFAIDEAEIIALEAELAGSL